MMLSTFVKQIKIKEVQKLPQEYITRHITVDEELYYWNRGRKQYQRFPRVSTKEKAMNMRKAQQRNFRLLRLRGARVNLLGVIRELGIKPPTYITGFFDTVEKIILQETPKRP